MSVRRLAGMLSAAGLAAATACAGGSSAGDPPVPAPDCATGTLVAAGSSIERRVLLDLPNNGDLTLVGDADADLASLTGAVVRVCGEPVTVMDAPGMDVESWSLVSVDDLEAFAGVLVAADGGWRLEGIDPAGSSLGLAAVPDALTRMAGGRVWVAGVWEGERFAVRSWGTVGG